MNRTCAPLLLASLALVALGGTGCHRHRLARMYRVEAPPPVMAPARGPLVIVVESGGATMGDPYAAEAAAAAAVRDDAARQAAAREAALRQARLEQERAARARMEQERAARARIEQERAERDAQARAAAQGGTMVIVVTPGGAQTVPAGSWFNAQ